MDFVVPFIDKKFKPICIFCFHSNENHLFADVHKINRLKSTDSKFQCNTRMLRFA